MTKQETEAFWDFALAVMKTTMDIALENALSSNPNPKIQEALNKLEIIRANSVKQFRLIDAAKDKEGLE